MAPAGRAGKAGGQLSRRVRGSPPAPVPPDGGRGPLPVRHLFDLPRGRGPSQTPKFLSPGPPSPWLPALPIEWLFYRFCGEPQVQPRGCKGRSPLHKKAKNLPLPGGKGVGGDGGKKEGKGRGQQAAKTASHPFRHHSGKVNRQPKPPRPPPGTTAARKASPAGLPPQKINPHANCQQSIDFRTE